MLQLIWISLGGAVGTGCRYLVGTWSSLVFGNQFPYGTLLVNIVGSFFLSVVMALSIEAELISGPMLLFLATGVMGGFTTYSSFNYETLEMLRGGAWTLAATNVVVTLVGCSLAGITGLFVGTKLT